MKKQHPHYNIFIGHDQKEDIAAEICKFSILGKSVGIDASDIHFLKSKDIPEFTRPREPNQSTDFTYTRFLVPFLSKYKGYSLFCDCDFLFLDDVLELFSCVDKSKAISVVKHPQYIPNSQIKMDGVQQHSMPRKNWASLILFNNSHPSCKLLTPDFVNTIMPGRKLHTFDWVSDDDIGSISMDWNTLDGYYHLDNPRAIHYTDGGPWFDNYKNTMYSKYWIDEYEWYQQTRTKLSYVKQNHLWSDYDQV